MNPSSWTLQDWTNASQIVAMLIAVGALVVSAIQTRQAAATARAQFWLDLRKMFAEHQAVHLNLRPGGQWAQPGAGPQTNADWVAVEAYMGLFEHCEQMLRDKLIDTRTFKAIYAYRLRNLLANPSIVDAKLRRAASGWKDFLSLLDRLEIKH